MATTTLTGKGQVTIPSEVRERMRWRTGDRLDFSIGEDGRVVVERLSQDARGLRGVLRRKGQAAVPVESMDRAVGEYLAEKHRRR